jgi:RNA polymerase sigma-70 factor (ECF subfamily)
MLKAIKTTAPRAPDQDAPEADSPSMWLENHGDYLFRYALLRVRNRATAEDLVQETLISAIKGWERFEGRSSVRTWLTEILLNKIIDLFRSAERRLVSTATGEELEGAVEKHFNVLGLWNSVLSDWGSNPQVHLENRGFVEALSKCTEKLPELSRRAFLLRVVDGRPAEEVCNVLQITPSNLWVLIHRARHALRDCVERNWINKS